MSVVLGWEAINKKLSDRSRKGQMFLSLKPDEEAIVCFVGEPCMTEVIWGDAGYELFDPKKHTEKKPTQRFSINVYLEKDNQVSIFEGPSGFFEELKRARNQNDFATSVFCLKRVGEGQKTQYKIRCVMAITDQTRQKIDALPKHDLEQRALNSGKPKTSSASHWFEDRPDAYSTAAGFDDNMPF